MRHLVIHVPHGQGDEVVRRAESYDPLNILVSEGRDEEGPRDVVTLDISNGRVEGLLEELESLDDLRVSFFPKDVISLKPPPDEAPGQVTDVEMRSPIEIYLSGHQSIGSWLGHLGYSVAAGVVVWIGLFANTVFLLTAAMLIAPFAGPAMNVAIGSASGHGSLLGRSLLRYVAALLVTIVVTALLTLLLGPKLPTTLMLAQSQVPQVAVLLPLIAGAAGALTLVQSEHDSLVSGAATGMLVAASLAPPAGLVGMAGAMGEWSLAGSGAFLLVLQLVGINSAAAVIFRLRGVASGGGRYQTDMRRLFPISMTVTLVALAGLLYLQLSGGPALERGTVEQHITAEVKQFIDDDPLSRPVEVRTRFTRSDVPGQQTVLIEGYIQPDSLSSLQDDTLRKEVTRRVQQQVRQQRPELTPLVSLSVLEPLKER